MRGDEYDVHQASSDSKAVGSRKGKGSIYAHPGVPLRTLVAVSLAIFGVLLQSTSTPARPSLSSRGHFPASPAAARDTPDLGTVLALQRTRYPGAVVTGAFYDWRTVSRYRRRAGLHLGYDVAMPAGTPAVAGWTGQVTRIACWSGAEYGITLVSPGGFEVTYGHLSPRVKVGDVLNPGDPVGMVVVDHVDIKMRGPDGLYFDFGHGTPPVAGIPALPPGVSVGPWAMRPPAPTREDELRHYAMATWTARLGQEEYLRARDAAAEIRSQRANALQAQADLPKLRELLEDGLISRVELEQAAARLATLDRAWREAERDLQEARARVEGAQRKMEQSRVALSRMGVGRGQLDHAVETAMREPTGDAAKLRQMKAEAATRSEKLDKQHRKKLAQARQEMERMEHLFEQDAVSRMERDRARQRYQVLLRS